VGVRRGAVPALVVALALAWSLATAEKADSTTCVDIATALEEAPVVFVGTVVEISFSDGDRLATLRVEEVWKGEVGRVVVVDGGRPPQKVRRITGSLSNLGRMFHLGGRYLVAPFEEDGVLRDNSCSATRWYTNELDRLRPPNARTIAWEASRSTPGEIRFAGGAGMSTWARDWSVPSLVLAVGGVLVFTGGFAAGRGAHRSGSRR
jgi:hypothetical protein